MDTGLYSLAYAARYLGISAEIGQMKRSYSVTDAPLTTALLLRAAQELGLKARSVSGLTWANVRSGTFPILLRLSDGSYIALLAVLDNGVLVQDPQHDGQQLVVKVSRVQEIMSGEGILLAKRAKMQEQPKKFGISWFWEILQRYRKGMGNVCLLSLLLNLLGLTAPIFMQVIIDRVLVHRSLDTLDVLLVGMVLSLIFQQAMGGVRTYLLSHLVNQMDTVLGSRLFQNMAHLSRTSFDRWTVGDIVARMGEMENLRAFMTGSALYGVLDLVFVFIYLIAMQVYSPLLCVAAVCVLPFFILVNLIAAPIFHRQMNRQFQRAAENQAFVIETIRGIGTVKSTATERFFIERYEDLIARYVASMFSVAQTANIAGSINFLLQNLYSLAILWLGAVYVMEGTLSIGELIGFQMIAAQLIQPVIRLSEQWQFFQQARVSMQRVGDLMDGDKEKKLDLTKGELPRLKGGIQFEEVSFTYREDGAPIIRDLSFGIQPGLSVGVVGRSGSGKSTLAKLIQCFYVPGHGRVLLDGMDATRLEPAWLRRQIGVVLQANHLFHGSIEENIKISAPDADHESVVRAAELAGADEFITQMPDGYDSDVGEDGKLLSGGQRQRIAIARALLTDPSILIFDEATSALDARTEAQVMQQIAGIAKGRTLLMIAHRLHTVRHCDAILFMEKGRIIEGGSHEELMQRRGAYYELYMEQEM